MAVIGREPHALPDGGTFATGNYRFRYCKLPICRTEGMLVSFSKKRREHCSVRIFSIIWATSNRSPSPMSWAAQAFEWLGELTGKSHRSKPMIFESAKKKLPSRRLARERGKLGPRPASLTKQHGELIGSGNLRGSSARRSKSCNSE